MLVVKTLASVAPEVDCRECALHSPPQKANKAEPTVALKHRGDVTRNPKQDYQWPQIGHAYVSAKNIFKKVFLSFRKMVKYCLKPSGAVWACVSRIDRCRTS